jgi:hypothetical protein
MAGGTAFIQRFILQQTRRRVALMGIKGVGDWNIMRID